MRLAGSRMNADGILVIDARQFRTQEANRKDALVRLATLIRKASEEPRLRKKTRPSAGSKERRIQAKRRRADVKRTRKAPLGKNGIVETWGQRFGAVDSGIGPHPTWTVGDESPMIKGETERGKRDPRHGQCTEGR